MSLLQLHNLGRLGLSRERLLDFCQRWNVTELALFGSILRDDFGPDSDVDVLVSFDPTSRPTLFSLATMQQELEQLIGRHVDLLAKNGVQQAANPFRRRAILDSAKVIYAR